MRSGQMKSQTEHRFFRVLVGLELLGRFVDLGAIVAVLLD
jgi:hypothetical protein